MVWLDNTDSLHSLNFEACSVGHTFCGNAFLIPILFHSSIVTPIPVTPVAVTEPYSVYSIVQCFHGEMRDGSSHC